MQSKAMSPTVNPDVEQSMFLDVLRARNDEASE